MQFAHPEILYALSALIIPILVHLFQLRRFKIQEFTNLAFLKIIKLQTRKSSTLKKWLVLSLRLLALSLSSLPPIGVEFQKVNKDIASFWSRIKIANDLAIDEFG